MQFYRCPMRGENFPGDLVGENRPVCFYATRFVEARDLHVAKQLALESLRQEGALKSKAAKTSDAKVYFEEVIEVSAEVAALAKGGVGVTFYSGK